MDNRLNLTVKQLILILSVAALLAAAIAVLIFYLGQQSGLQLAGQKELTPTASMPPLPKAMTATPRPKETQTFIFTESMLTEAAQTGTGDDLPVSVDAVHITPTDVTIDGQIDYMGYLGAVSVTGQPYVENGRLRLRLTTITLEDQPLPDLLYPSVEEQINLFFEQVLTGFDVEAILLETGQMTVSTSPW